MRLMIVAALAALSVFGQDAKVAPDAKSAVPTERALSEVEVLKLKLATSQIENLQKDYKISEYQEKVQPIAAEQRRVAVAACASVGVAEANVERECGLSFGKGPDGKELMPRVWKIQPAPEKK